MSLEDDILAKLKSANAQQLQNQMINSSDNNKNYAKAALFSELSDYAAIVQTGIKK